VPDLYALYKSWRNRLADLDRRESLYVIWAYSQAISVSDFAMPNDITVDAQLVGSPGAALNLWELELLAGEIILNAGEAARRQRSLRDPAQLVRVVQGLRALENEIYGANEGAADALIEIWRISHRQFTWQQKRMTAAETIRYYMIYSDQVINRICTERLGLSVYDVYFIDMLFVGRYLTSYRQAYPIETDIPGLNWEKIDKWLAFASTEMGTLAGELKKTHKVDESYAYRYSPLRQHPILKQQYAGAVELVSPMPMLAHWRVTVGLYYALMADKDFPNALGASFQRVCGEIVRRGLPASSFTISAEASYGTKQKPRSTLDWIIEDNDNNVMLLECKAVRATVQAKEALTDLAALEQNFEKLSESLVQVYQRIIEYKQGLWPQLPYSKDKILFPIVVTLEDWFLLGPRITQLLDDKVRAGLRKESIDPAVTEEAPYAVISINDLERLVQVIAVAGIFEIVAGKFLDDEKRTWLWHGYLGDHVTQIQLRPTLFEDEWEAMFQQHLG
jgi:hypothetical protein